MSWQSLGSVQLNYWIEPQLLNFEFHSQRIIIKAESAFAQPSWRRAGWTQQVFVFPETGITRSTARRVYLQTQILEFSTISLPSYQLQYMLPGWLPYVTLSFWEEAF